MRTITLTMVSMVAILSSTAARAEQVKPVDYDCALFNECSETAGNGPVIDRGKTKGFSMAGAITRAEAPKPAARVGAVPVQRPRPAAVAMMARAPVAAPMSAASGVDLQLNFISGSADLTPGARASADRLAAAMARPDRLATRFTIEGHTDAVGNPAANLDLSKRRAAAVVSYLAGKGVDTKRFVVEGYGSARPLPGMSAMAGANRRVVAKAIK